MDLLCFRGDWSAVQLIEASEANVKHQILTYDFKHLCQP